MPKRAAIYCRISKDVEGSGLLNPAVAGLRLHRREIAGPAEREPILDRATWEQVRGVLADPARRRRQPPRRYLLAGLVTNPAGDRMNGRPDQGRRTYATRSPATPAVQIDADEMEAEVVAQVLAALDEAILPDVKPAPDAGEVGEFEAEMAELARLRGEGVVSLGEWLAAPNDRPWGHIDRRHLAAHVDGSERDRQARTEKEPCGWCGSTWRYHEHGYGRNGGIVHCPSCTSSQAAPRGLGAKGGLRFYRELTSEEQAALPPLRGPWRGSPSMRCAAGRRHGGGLAASIATHLSGARSRRGRPPPRRRQSSGDAREAPFEVQDVTSCSSASPHR